MSWPTEILWSSSSTCPSSDCLLVPRALEALCSKALAYTVDSCSSYVNRPI